MGVLIEILSNQTIFIPATAWFIAQTAKVFSYVLQNKKFDFRRFFGSGGMPSSHSAFVVSLATVVGRNEGFDSAVFGVAFVIALIVMYDAAGVRRAAGRQAQVLNKLIAETQKGGDSHFEERLKELIGHSPVEVFIGALLGIVVAVWFG